LKALGYMPFKNRFFVCSQRCCVISLYALGLMLLSHSVHAERVLSETTFDERGVEAKTFDQVNPPQSSEKGETLDIGLDESSEPPASIVKKFFSRLFGGDKSSQISSEGAVKDQADLSAVANEQQALESQRTDLNSEQSRQQRLDALVGGPSTEPGTQGKNAQAVTQDETVATEYPSPPMTSTFDLEDDARRAERLQTIFGDSEIEGGLTEVIPEPKPKKDDLPIDTGTVAKDAEPDPMTVEKVESEKLASQTDSDLNDQPRNPVQSPNLLQRFLNLFKGQPDESVSSEGADTDTEIAAQTAREAESYAADLPSIQGQPDVRPSLDGQPQPTDRSDPLDSSQEIPEPSVSDTQPLVPAPIPPNNRLREPRSKKSPPKIAKREQDLTDSPGVLNPLMIGKKLDAFAIDLINDIRTGAGREPFNAFSQSISSVFFSTPTVLRLVELERTIKTQITEAEALGRPQVSFSAEEGRRSVSNGGSDGRISSQTVTATQNIWDFGIIGSGVKQSENNVDKTLAEIRNSRSEALLDLILAYNEVATARLNMDLVNVFAETRIQFLDLVDQKLALGVSSQADLVRAEAKAYEAQGELPAAAQRLQAAEDRFAELFGVIPPAELQTFALPSNTLSLAELGLMTERHPTVRASELDYQNAQLSLQRLSAEKLGAINFQLTGSRSDTPSTASTDQLDGKIVYQVDLYDGGDLSARLERASGAVVEARWELERVRRETRRVLESAISELVASQSLESARLNSLEATVKASDATKELFMYDRGDLTDIFRVQDDYLNAAKALVEARANSQNAFYSSLHAADLLIDQFGLGI